MKPMVRLLCLASATFRAENDSGASRASQNAAGWREAVPAVAFAELGVEVADDRSVDGDEFT